MASTQNALRSQISKFYEYCRRVGYVYSVFKLKGAAWLRSLDNICYLMRHLL
nr:MAG TPA: integrase [Caudoviricetes sp.]